MKRNDGSIFGGWTSENEKSLDKLAETAERLFGDTLVAENDHWKYYTNSWTEQYTRNINKYDEDGITLPDKMTVLLVEAKDDGYRSYVAFDTKGRPYMEWTDSFNFELHLKALKLKIAEQNNIVNIAKRLNDEHKD